ncbi:hypothetical protein TRAPUB_1212 [Trametes pubescens]|uniref:Uncharacterized protein n=1 Tax=Trametes pubescens TaxID=154538 RepID=A0A1M2VK39_TRAPU|nr:hypothetical protein TRAPUB_1212 [Trametes pubescens]
MPRPTWATNEQAVWLASHKKGFTDAQAASAPKTWLDKTTEAFALKWPDEWIPSAKELAVAKGDVAKANANRAKKMRGRVKWWYRNRSRANADTGTGISAVLPLACKKPQLLLPYQAYMRTHRAHVMAQIKSKYDAYVATVEDGLPARGAWGFTCEEAARMLESETDAVKAEVEAFRQKQYRDRLPQGVAPETLVQGGVEDAQQKVQAMQAAINMLPKTGYAALKAIYQQTGWKGSMLLGGPDPQTGIHEGRTLIVDNIWPDASGEWATVQAAFESFIARCYPAELPQQLETVYSGVPLPSGTVPAVVLSALTTSGPQATRSNASTAGAASIVTSEPSVINNTPTTGTAPSPPTQTPTESSIKAKASGPAEIDYEDLRNMTIRRNTEMMRRVLAGETFEAIKASMNAEGSEFAVPGGESPVEIDEDLPEWVVDAREYLLEVSDEGWWRELIEGWLELERALGFPDGQAQRNWLPSKGRPEEVKHWIGRGRQYAKPPPVKSLPTFISSWRQWWTRLQPAVRRGDDATWPLPRAAPEHSSAWADIKRGGCNGLFMVLMCLSWWIGCVDSGGDGGMADVREAADDVLWTCMQMTPSTTPASNCTAEDATNTVITPVEPTHVVHGVTPVAHIASMPAPPVSAAPVSVAAPVSAAPTSVSKPVAPTPDMITSGTSTPVSPTLDMTMPGSSTAPAASTPIPPMPVTVAFEPVVPAHVTAMPSVSTPILPTLDTTTPDVSTPIAPASVALTIGSSTQALDAPAPVTSTSATSIPIVSIPAASTPVALAPDVTTPPLDTPLRSPGTSAPTPDVSVPPAPNTPSPSPSAAAAPAPSLSASHTALTFFQECLNAAVPTTGTKRPAELESVAEHAAKKVRVSSE